MPFTPDETAAIERLRKQEQLAEMMQNVHTTHVEWFDDPEFQEWLNELAENMGDEWDRDEAMIAIVVDYVRYLESLRPGVERLVAALRSTCEDFSDAVDRLSEIEFTTSAVEDERVWRDAIQNARVIVAEFGQQPTGGKE